MIEVVQAVWDKYQGKNLPAMINEVAWRLHNKDPKWGLSYKPSGHNIPQPKTGIPIAADIVQYGPTTEEGLFQGYDAFQGNEANTPMWGEAGQHNNPDRRWVRPVEPEEVDEPEPVPDPIPVPNPLEEKVRSLEALLTTLREEFAGKLTELTTKVDTLLAKPFPNLTVSGKTSRTWGHSHDVNLKVTKNEG